jgi:hypothetical protein
MPNENKIPDHSLLGTDIPKNDESPKVYAVSDLRALAKPELDEELGASDGGLATCTTEILCSCVPVETCACNTVTYGSNTYVGTPSECSCDINSCVCKYWFPY